MPTLFCKQKSKAKSMSNGTSRTGNDFWHHIKTLIGTVPDNLFNEVGTGTAQLSYSHLLVQAMTCMYQQMWLVFTPIPVCQCRCDVKATAGTLVVATNLGTVNIPIRGLWNMATPPRPPCSAAPGFNCRRSISPDKSIQTKVKSVRHR